ncbi:MAG: S8 family serine peptidase [Alphaproteobacteria bacterium]|nr:S8 family serine peptidase [Alphaproteobacteria bacterium]
MSPPPPIGFHLRLDADPAPPAPQGLLGGGGGGAPLGHPTFTGVDPDALARLVARARALDPTYEDPGFARWRTIAGVPQEMMLGEPAGKALGARYPAFQPTGFTLRDKSLLPQPYLDDAPGGVAATRAWDRGGTGRQVQFADIEQAWDVHHHDLPRHHLHHVFGHNRRDDRTALDHGTHTLGVVAALHNDIDATGIAHEAGPIYLSSYLDHRGQLLGVHNAILAALPHLHPGDVLLTEVQLAPRGEQAPERLPVEVEMPTFLVLRLATALGIVVVEPAGNGDVDLDAHVTDDGRTLSRDPASDSGAILVGGALRKANWLATHNRGSRIDVRAHAAYVATLRSFDATIDNYNGTSSAAAIIAGVALCVQSARLAAGRAPLRPAVLRAMLAVGGTPVYDATGLFSGVVPDLTAVLRAALDEDGGVV